MPVIEIELEDDEDIVRVYTRIPEQTWLFGKLVAADFARIMHRHSGISLLRLKYLTRQEARNWFETPKLKGLAICKAIALKDLGLVLHGQWYGYQDGTLLGCLLVFNDLYGCSKPL